MPDAAHGSDPSRLALAEFLRSRRERLAPERAGLARTARRRTSGLRREEVAILAGISQAWYIKLEQGREVSASAPTLDRIARALQLSPAERAHLFALAQRRDPALPNLETDDSRLAALQGLIAAIAVPAYVIDRWWTALAWNQPAAALLEPWLLRPNPNLLEFVFLDDAAARLIVDWENRARRLVAECRAEQAFLRGEPAMAALVDRLRSQSPAFDRYWRDQQVLDMEGGIRHFYLADGAVGEFDQISLLPGAASAMRLVTLVPRAV